MIFKLQFPDRTEFCTAKDEKTLQTSYVEEYDEFDKLEKLTVITDEEAKKIMLENTDYDETDPDDVETISLFDLAVGDQFAIIGSTEFD
jgi:hypothetical protein